MDRAIEFAKEEFAVIRTGRATPAMFSKIIIDYYGTPTPLPQMASIATPEPRMAIIKPYDTSQMHAMEKAIRDSDLGVNPNNEGTQIRIILPQMTEERRREMIKGARHRARHEPPAAPDAYPPPGPPDAYPPVPGYPPGVGFAPPERYLSPVEPVSPLDLAPPEEPPEEREPPEVPAPPTGTGRAGRNLPAAIGVGAGLGAVVLVSLLIRRPAFLFVIAAAAAVAIWEMVRALAHDGGPRAPLVPLFGGAGVMIVLAWFAGAEALPVGLVLTVLAAMVWRLADGPAGYQRDLLATVLVAVYVPFLAGFAVLLLHPRDGAARIIVTLAMVVLSDTGGYVAGVFFGQHAMAPTVSPKKSWEGTAGSLLIAGTGGALFGVGVSAAAVLGDLAESLLKRDLRIKDMSNLLPGHGGVMDRLDSVLFALPTAFVLFSVLVPLGSGG